MRRRRIARLLCSGWLFTLGTAACADAAPDESDSTAAKSTTTALPVPLDVERHTEPFVDTSRPTVDPTHQHDAPSRSLPTDIYIPDGPGPFPLIVHAHGYDGAPSKFTQLLTGWAEAGYVVAAPKFPLTNEETAEALTMVPDYVNQPADVSFVIDELLRLASTEGAALSGKIDAENIGVSGLSLGGGTVYGVAFNACCRDERVDASIVMSGFRFPFDEAFDLSGIPLMILHGTIDPALPYASAEDAYADASAPKYFVTLIGALHPEPYEDTPSPHDDVTANVTLDFWQAYLRNDDDALARIPTDATVDEIASIEFQR